MKTKGFLAGTLLGFAAGMFAAKLVQTKALSPEQALKRVKSALRDQLNIEGSWIQMKPEQLQKNKLTYTVYQGGLTSNEGHIVKHYDFAVDVKSGTIIDLTAHE